VTFADTSFLVKLYLREEESEQAEALVRTGVPPLLISELAVLELRNALHFAVARGAINGQESAAAWAGFERHLQAGVVRTFCPPSPIWLARAQEWADRCSPDLLTRSLDLLHLAAADLAGAHTFLTYDRRQEAAAVRRGWRVREGR